MNQFWQNLITNISWGALIVGGISWILRKFIDHFFSNKIEQYKADLERENTKFRITYEKLHAERAEVIKEIYRKISKTYNALESVIAPMQLAGEKPMEEIMVDKRIHFMDTANNFLEYFQENKIFFNKDLVNDIDKLDGGFRTVWKKWSFSQINGRGRQNVEEWNKAWDQLKTDVSQTKSEIENKFRKLIGIE